MNRFQCEDGKIRRFLKVENGYKCRNCNEIVLGDVKKHTCTITEWYEMLFGKSDFKEN